MIQSRLRHASLTKRKTQITCAFTRHMFEGNTRAALQLLIGQDRGGVLNFNDPADPSIILNVQFVMLSMLSIHLLNLFIQNVFCLWRILLQSTQLCLMSWMLLWFVLLLSVRWVLLDHLGLMLVDGGGCAPPFVQLRMNFVVQLLCLPDGYVPPSFLQIFCLHFWVAGSLLWASLQEFCLLEFARWCDALWQRLPSMLFEMTFKLQQDRIN